MNGVHDMGGMDGFGTVEPETDEPVFHAPWEGRVIAMMRAMGAAGAWNLDMFRTTRERQPPAVYLASSYYKSWALALETLALKRGFVQPDELTGGHALHPPKALPRGVLRAKDAPAVVVRGSYERPATTPARFKVGDRVKAKNIHPTTHTRLPRYARGHVGVVERLLGCQVFPDSSALGDGDDPRWLYTVVFEGRELWGADAEATLKVSIDAFEPYLEPA
jgi:nitrile hydratase